jgi:general secretion pathway protein M
MMAGKFSLPEGRAGQLLAVGGAVVILAVIWLGLVSPCLDWYAGRQAMLDDSLQQVAHMQAEQKELPYLRQAAAASASSHAGQILVPGDSDAISGANLQADLTNLAQTAGTSLDSVETVATTPVGSLRRIGVAVSMSTTWPTLVAFLTAIETAQPRMMVDDLSVTSDSTPDAGQDVALQANFTVSAFRSGSP